MADAPSSPAASWVGLPPQPDLGQIHTTPVAEPLPGSYQATSVPSAAMAHRPQDCGGAKVVEDGPRAVVQAPVAAERGSAIAEETDDPLRELQVAGRRVLHLEELSREAAEVVDGLGACVCGDERAGLEPVRRDRENRRCSTDN